MAAETGGGSGDPGLPPLAPPDRQLPGLKVPEVAGKKLGWAVVGLGELALGEVMPAFVHAHLSQPVALVSGHPDKAKKVAESYGIDPKAIYNYDNFDRIKENPAIDIVYVILPNSMHAEFTIRALRAGKHVLCEKPMATTPDEGEQMIAASRETGRKLMIAYRMHYEPMTQTVATLLQAGAFGKPKTIASSNCQNTPAPNIRLSRALGGGPVGDVGIYCFNTSRFLLGEDPIEVSAMAHQPKDEPRFREVPESVAFTLKFGSGVLAHCDCSFGSTESRRFRVHCTDGYLEMDPAFSYRGLRLRAKQGDAQKNSEKLEEWKIREINQFAAEMDHFSECAATGQAPRTPGEEGLKDLKIIAAIGEAAESRQTVALKF